jgi:hypothetical protein
MLLLATAEPWESIFEEEILLLAGGISIAKSASDWLVSFDNTPGTPKTNRRKPSIMKRRGLVKGG